MSTQTETIDITMPDTRPDLHLLENAINAIQATILEDHRQYFHHNVNVTSLLDELRTLYAGNSPSDRRLAISSQKFALFVRSFAPYFDILSLCIPLRPEWAGWFWGTVYLIFKVGSDYNILLEKTADMFEAIAHIVAPYQQIYERCKSNDSIPNLSPEGSHLALLMSNVYADLVHLCLDLYRMFSRGALSYKLRHPTLELTQSALWRPLDSRFLRLETRLTRHRRWLENETENRVQNYADIAVHRQKYVEFLQHQNETTGFGQIENEEQKISKRMRRVAKVQRWLSSRSFSPDMQGSQDASQHVESCAWFFEMPAYRKWKDESSCRWRANDTSSLESTWQHRILFTQAIPGFGKTMISREVAEHLTAEAEDPEYDDEPPATASFLFSLGRSDCSNADVAFRSLTCQLLQTHRRDHLTLDAVCLLLRRTSLREIATIDEVLDVLTLLLRQHPTYLVLDGVDECSDFEDFLTSLAGVCRKSDVKVILFSRPNIRIPLEYQKWASDAPHIITLTYGNNAAAIEHFVARQLTQMADKGFFGISMDRALIPHVARVSGGVFLWARMLLNFLQSPLLSSDERHIILQNVQSLQGLEPLYLNMLSVLGRQPQQEKRIAADVFRWLSFSIHQLSPLAIRAALATLDSALPGGAHPNDVIDVLPDLTCGLLCTQDGNMAFAHRSIREYLQAPISHASNFSLCDESDVHAQLAARCLSYLAHEVPKRPLEGLRPLNSPTLPAIPTSSAASQRTNRSGDSGYKSLSSSEGDNFAMIPAAPPTPESIPNDTNIRTIPFDTHLPFLRYAALCWPIHLSRALSPHNHHANESPSLASLPFLRALSAFLSSRVAVTAWVETSFRYNLPPTLTRLIGPLSDLKGEISPSTVEGKELRLRVNELRELSERLVDLKREYEGTLRQNPSLVWQMDGAVGEAAYWPVWEEIVDGGS